MLITGIRSKPVYAPLQPDLRGRYHLMVGYGVGAAPLLRLLAQLKQAAPQGLAQTRVWYLGDAAPADAPARATDAFRALNIAELRTFAQVDALLADLTAAMNDALMGTRLYVAGPESFMGLVMRIAQQFNLKQDEVRAEECGTLARRVHCVHCRSTIEDVRTNIVQCSCQRWLVVRDHYSRRLAAYMGLMVDAEAPGERPQIKETFL
jgi:dimethylamine monooxygenase subunit C